MSDRIATSDYDRGLAFLKRIHPPCDAVIEWFDGDEGLARDAVYHLTEYNDAPNEISVREVEALGRILNAMRLELAKGELVVISRDEDGEWYRSEFPHPLVTLDFDSSDNLIQVTVAGHGKRPA